MSRPLAPRWPDNPAKAGDSLFEPRPSLRTLRVVVDVAALEDDGVDRWSATRLLAGILEHHEFLEVIRFHDDGPPADAPTRCVVGGEDLAVG